jgi:hypothetical protein
VARFDVPYDCSVELSQLGYQFFTDLFETFDKVIDSRDVPQLKKTDVLGYRIRMAL